MNKFIALISFTLLMLSASLSFAAEKTITLSVPDMNCPSCPYMVEQSISFVEGVQSVNAELKTRTCSVTFDDAVASIDDILGATANIGYKSSVVDAGNDS
jgi:mercuric ion binding protein